MKRVLMAFVYIPHLQWLPDGRSLLVNGRDAKGAGARCD
jgi:hypothetical protein